MRCHQQMHRATARIRPFPGDPSMVCCLRRTSRAYLMGTGVPLDHTGHWRNLRSGRQNMSARPQAGSCKYCSAATCRGIRCERGDSCQQRTIRDVSQESLSAPQWLTESLHMYNVYSPIPGSTLRLLIRPVVESGFAASANFLIQVWLWCEDEDGNEAVVSIDLSGPN
jgi:hypothetical protein